MADEKKIATGKTEAKNAVPKKVAAKKAITKKAAAKKTVTEKAVAAKKVTATKKLVSKKATAAATPAASRTASAVVERPKRPQPKPAPTPQTSLPLSEGPGIEQSPAVSQEEREAMIQEAAYYKAEQRDFAPGFEAEDWADAEREVDAQLKKG